MKSLKNTLGMSQSQISKVSMNSIKLNNLAVNPLFIVHSAVI